MMLVMVTPAAANRGYPSGRMEAQDVGADCEQAAMDTPDRPAGLKVTTDVPNGATVAPGQDIVVRLTWDPKAWSGDQLDAALACVAVKGALDPNLSSGERPTANDGVFEYVLHVPDNIRPGCDICVQGFLAGIASGGGPRQVTSDRPCFMSGEPRPPTPVTRPPATPATTPPAPTTTTAPQIPTEVAGIQASKPSPAPLQPAPAAVPAPAAELPRTGTPLTQLASAGGGLTLSLGGLAVIGGAGRRTRRRAKR
jgi:hypothetical protein